MATKEIERDHQKEDILHRALTMAVATLVERIRGLPKDDRDDLFELVKDLPRAESDEEVESIMTSMLEILDQRPVGVRKMDLPADTKPGVGLKKWMDFVGGRIKSLREQSGMTQTELADKSGLPQSHISRLEKGTHSPSRATVERIAKALGVPVSELDPSA